MTMSIFKFVALITAQCWHSTFSLITSHVIFMPGMNDVLDIKIIQSDMALPIQFKF